MKETVMVHDNIPIYLEHVSLIEYLLLFWLKIVCVWTCRTKTDRSRSRWFYLNLILTANRLNYWCFPKLKLTNVWFIAWHFPQNKTVASKWLLIFITWPFYQEYRVVTKEYLARGKDGFDVLTSCPVLVSMFSIDIEV